MTDYILIEKIWQDVFCYQVKITCASSHVVATNDIYISNDSIDALFSGLNDFIKGKTKEFFWESGEKGDNSTACITFKFTHKDRLGHILVEVYRNWMMVGVTVVTTVAFISIQRWDYWRNFAKNSQHLSENY